MLRVPPAPAPQAVPQDAAVYFREPSFWESYRHYLLIAADRI